MALFENTAKAWIPNVLIGVGVVLAAPILLPALAAGIRPLAKMGIKGGLLVADLCGGIVNEAKKQATNLVAEVRAEMAAPPSALATAEKGLAGLIEEVVEEAVVEVAEVAVESL
jgi:hypothetical protein